MYLFHLFSVEIKNQQKIYFLNHRTLKDNWGRERHRPVKELTLWQEYAIHEGLLEDSVCSCIGWIVRGKACQSFELIKTIQHWVKTKMA